MLRSEGHVVEAELEADKALKHISRFQPDLVVLDVMFPGDPTAGFTLARSIRERHAALPIVMVSSVNEGKRMKIGDKDIDPAWLPISKFIEKPVKRPQLVSAVKELLGPERGVRHGL
jgi:CheY-like chemotaxis protein